MLKFKDPITFLVFPSLYFCATLGISENFQILVSFSSIICFFYVLLTLYSFFCIWKTPEVKEFYDLKKSIKIHGLRSFSTTAKVVHICKLCFQGGAGLFLASYAVPKGIFGASYRSPIINQFGYLFTGLKSNNEIVYSAGVQFSWDYPELKSKIVESDNCTISKEKLIVQMVAKGSHPFLYGLKKEV